MTILVTGSSGFIGSHLVEALKKDNINVVQVDKITGDDLCNTDFIEKLINEKMPSMIVHLAAVSDVSGTDDDIDRENIRALRRLLVACEKSSVKKIIFASSCSIYGTVDYKVNENSSLEPESSYAFSKIFGELYIKNFCRAYGKQYIILRFGNVYGTGGHCVINKWLQRIKEGKTIEIFGSGENIRDYVFIDDIVKTIKKCLSYDRNLVMNVGTGIKTSLFDLIKILEDNFGAIDKDFLQPKNVDPLVSMLDVSLMKRVFSWTPDIEIKEGIKRIIDNDVVLRRKRDEKHKI